MNLVAVSPFENALKEHILSFLKNSSADLIMLPGYSKNMPSAQEVQLVLQKGVSVFIEELGDKTEATPYMVTKAEIVAMPKQVFVNAPTAKNIDNLIACLPKRTFNICDRSITFLLCGEIIAFNPDGSVKHGGIINFDILANPGHSLMGHWNHLGKKLEALSNKTIVLYSVNNTKNSHKLITDVRIYNNKVQLDDYYIENSIKWLKCEI